GPFAAHGAALQIEFRNQVGAAAPRSILDGPAGAGFRGFLAPHPLRPLDRAVRGCAQKLAAGFPADAHATITGRLVKQGGARAGQLDPGETAEAIAFPADIAGGGRELADFRTEDRVQAVIVGIDTPAAARGAGDFNECSVAGTDRAQHSGRVTRYG